MVFTLLKSRSQIKIQLVKLNSGMNKMDFFLIQTVPRLHPVHRTIIYLMALIPIAERTSSCKNEAGSA